MKKYFLQWLIIILLLISVFYLPKAMLLYSGYCFKEERYLGEQEKFNIVVTEIINRKDAAEDQHSAYVFPAEGRRRRAYTANEAGGKLWLTEVLKTSFRYSSLEEFYALNPNSCELVETLVGGEYLWLGIPFRARAGGCLNTIVRVFYIYDFDEENENQPVYKEEYFGLSNCGELWTDWDIIKLHESARRF